MGCCLWSCRMVCGFSSISHMGMGQNQNQQGTAGFSPCFHLPGFRFGYLFLTHSHMLRQLRLDVNDTIEANTPSVDQSLDQADLLHHMQCAVAAALVARLLCQIGTSFRAVAGSILTCSILARYLTFQQSRMAGSKNSYPKWNPVE